VTYPGGLTTAGFQAETTADVQTSIERDELALMDPALNLSPTQPLGQLNGIFASAAANVWGLVQAIYSAIDPGGAIGVQLDNICALTGVTRLSATATQVLCTLNLNASQSYTAGQLVANIVGLPQYTFTNVNAVVSTTAGNYTGILFQCTQTGPIPCNGSTLTVITAAVGGWNSITNPGGGTVGTNVETDTALRLRRASLLVAAGGCTIDSIRSSLLNPTLVPGVLNASVLENNGDSTDALGTPAHSFQALIWDGAGLAASNTLIAQAIWNSKPSGIRAFGQTTAQALDATGKQQAVSFTRVTQLQTYFAVTVKTNPLTFPSGGGALIQAAVAGVLANILPGASVVALACEAAVMGVQGVIDIPSFTLDVVPSPVATANIVPTAFQIATFNTCTVTVT
jgi:uncharacterized phage protein gp47/JayE